MGAVKDAGTGNGGKRAGRSRRFGPARGRGKAGEVSTRFFCPQCGGDHALWEHGVAEPAHDVMECLGADELVAWRGQVVDELAGAVRQRGDQHHRLDGRAARRDRRAPR